MEELEIIVNQSRGEINTNFTELAAKLKEQFAPYENFVVAEDEISWAKDDLANIRKFRTSLENRRKEIKKQFLEPYEEFEEEYKKILEIVDKPINTISTQLNLFEQDRVAKKTARITRLYEEKVGELIEFLPITKYYNPKWNNKTYSNQDIEYDISELVTKVKSELDIIKSLNSEIEEKVIETYKASGNDLSKAIARNQQYISDKQVVEKTVKEEEKKAAPIEQLNDLVQKIRTAKIIVSMEDLQQAKNVLDFADIKYQIVED